MHVRRLTRSPLLYWAAAASLALLTATVVSRVAGAADAYGELRPAVVARRMRHVGEVLRPEDVVIREVPATFMPPDALGSLDTRRTVVAPIFPGQVVVRGQLAPPGRQGVDALLAHGMRAMAVPTGETTPPVRAGDVVDVLATFDAQPTIVVATEARVVAVRRDSVTIAVPSSRATRVAFALAAGTVTLAVVGVQG